MSSITPFNIEIVPNSLVVIGGRPGMGITTLGLSWILNVEDSRNGHFISLHTTLAVLDSQFQGIEKLNKSFVEQPSTLQLAEHIVGINKELSPDFFVIDSLDYIGKEKPKFLNENKKYQKQLRHLKVLAQAMNKPIFLLTTIAQSIEACEPFFYHRKVYREKYADYILILYRWEYYQEPIIIEDGTRLKENEALLIIGKSPKEYKTNYLVLKYDPANRLLKMK